MTDCSALTNEHENGTSPNWNQRFNVAVLAHKLGQQAAGLGLYEYSEPNANIEGDPVNGANLWTEFLTEHQEAYYIPAAEFKLAELLKTALPNIITEPVVISFLGPGNPFTFKLKDINATSAFRHIAGVQAIDINSQFLSASMEVIEKERPDLQQIGVQKRDMFTDGFSFPQYSTRPNMKKPVQLATMFGGTIVNGEVELEFGEPLLPKKQITRRLSSIRRSFGEAGGYFVVTQDANTDPNKITRAYEGQTRFLTNLAYRIKRDTKGFENAKADEAQATFKWHEDAKVLGHWLTLDFGDGKGPTDIMVESSPKIPTTMFLEWAVDAGWNSLTTIEENGVNAHILEATPTLEAA